MESLHAEEIQSTESKSMSEPVSHNVCGMFMKIAVESGCTLRQLLKSLPWKAFREISLFQAGMRIFHGMCNILIRHN